MATAMKSTKNKTKEISTLTLKWGTLKAWDLKTKKQLDLLEKYSKHGVCMSAMAQDDTKEQKEIICKIIDTITDPRGILLSWDGIFVSKADAKKYVMSYDG